MRTEFAKWATGKACAMVVDAGKVSGKDVVAEVAAMDAVVLQIHAKVYTTVADV